MHKVCVNWTLTKDIIYMPDHIFEKLDEYTDDFREWCAGTSFDSKIIGGTCFGIEQFIFFLNDRYCVGDEIVYLIDENYNAASKEEELELRNMKNIWF